MVSNSKGSSGPRHNHMTRDIKPLGACPACDEYHSRHSMSEAPDSLCGVKTTGMHTNMSLDGTCVFLPNHEGDHSWQQ
jgi:hypothetical protein